MLDKWFVLLVLYENVLHEVFADKSWGSDDNTFQTIEIKVRLHRTSHILEEFFYRFFVLVRSAFSFNRELYFLLDDCQGAKDFLKKSKLILLPNLRAKSVFRS